MITMDLVPLVKSEAQKLSSDAEQKAGDWHRAEASLSRSLYRCPAVRCCSPSTKSQAGRTVFLICHSGAPFLVGQLFLNINVRYDRFE